MTPGEAMNTIEERRFAALTNLASNLKTFLRIAAQQAEVEALSRAMANDPAVISEVLHRALALSAMPADGDREQIRAIFDPDIEWFQNEGFPGGGRYIGAETVITDVLGRLGEDWEGWRAEVDRWTSWEGAHFGPAIRKVAFERIVKKLGGLGAPDEAAVKAGIEDFAARASVLVKPVTS